MNPNDSNSVRRLSPNAAADLAMQLTRDWLATLDCKAWTPIVSRAAPCTVNPKPVGKTPSRWIVVIDWTRDVDDGSVFDGGSFAIADLVTSDVEWSELS